MPSVGMEGSLATCVYTCEARCVHVLINDDSESDLDSEKENDGLNVDGITSVPK